MAKNKPLKDEEYDSIDEIQTTLDRHTDKLNRIEAGLVSIKSEIASVSKTGGHNMDSSGDRQFIQLRNLFYDILDKLSKAYEELKTGKSDAQPESPMPKQKNCWLRLPIYVRIYKRTALTLLHCQRTRTSNILRLSLT